MNGNAAHSRIGAAECAGCGPRLIVPPGLPARGRGRGPRLLARRGQADVVELTGWTDLSGADANATAALPWTDALDVSPYRFLKIGCLVSARSGDPHVLINSAVSAIVGGIPRELANFDLDSGWDQQVFAVANGDPIGGLVNWSVEQATGAWSIYFRIIVVGVR